MMNLSETFFTSGAFEFLLKYEGTQLGSCGSLCYKVPLFRIGNDFLKSKVKEDVVRTTSHQNIKELWDFTCTKLYLMHVSDYDMKLKNAFIYINKDKFLIFAAVIAILNSAIVIESAFLYAKDFRIRMINRQYFKFIIG